MTIDPAGDLARLIDEVIRKRLAEACVAFPCKVLTFDESKGIASVQPLFQLNEQAPSPIQNVPVTGHKYRMDNGEIEKVPHILEPGDIVFVVCADRQIRDTLSGSITKPSSQRIHDKNDAVIVGVMPCSLFD
ncbi:Gp138 family membrane-puncturing spike protein [Brevibacillus porteri]|uniref:Gp138 family membrane-puncturing spike protein n=1 Tax=Brevibacillus porteri TaxID=2126350 RepID=UPI003D2509D4